MNQVYEQCVAKLIKTINEIDLTKSEVYKEFLAQTFFYTSHSEMLLRTFARDAENEAIKGRWLSHADEESGHENLALSDLKRMGESIDSFSELQSTKDLYEKQLPISKKTKGIGNFGWALALEGMAANINEDYVKSIIETHGLPATRFVKVHAEEDQEHIEKAIEAVSSLGVNDDIEANMLLTTEIYCQMLLDIRDRAQKKGKQAA